MAESTVASEILTMIKAEANNNPAPLLCTITGNYTDNNYVDIRINNETNILKHIRLIGDNTVGNTGVLVFIDGDMDNMVVISGDVLHKVAKTGDYNDLENKPEWTLKTITNGINLYINEKLQICHLIIDCTIQVPPGSKVLATLPTKYRPLGYVTAPSRFQDHVICYCYSNSDNINTYSFSDSTYSSARVRTSLFWHYGGV